MLVKVVITMLETIFLPIVIAKTAGYYLRLYGFTNKVKPSYGSPRITVELKIKGFNVSRPRVARLMKMSGIKAVHANKFVITTETEDILHLGI
jgi:hypothetical protein